jgi:general secretion pathway protein E
VEWSLARKWAAPRFGIRRKPVSRDTDIAPMADAVPVMRSHDRLDDLAEHVIASGQCEARTVARARSVAAESDQRLDTVMIQLGLLSERGLAQAYASLLGCAVAVPSRYPDAEPVLPAELPGLFLRNARAIPVAIAGRTLTVAMADPLDDFTVAAIAAATGLIVQREVALPIEIDAALDRLYPDAPGDESQDIDGLGGREPLEEDAERLKDLASEAPVIRLVNQIIFRAVETQASDIHLEPFEDRLRVRYRYDGELHESESQPAQLIAAITSRVKIMARLDIAERRLPQDGRIKLAVRGQEIDIRVSTVPSLHGEAVALRILDRSAVELDYSVLGLPPAIIDKLQAALELHNGIVLVTGPTGSGKTTTLYTGLSGLNVTARKIVTIEDPIEFQLDGINQIQVKPQIDLHFATLLRSILRQDPNVIMVGEIRDLETVQVAARAALTGHLVLSTIHTNAAAATITRLRDMGLEDYLIAATIRGVLAQRLVRRLCHACRSPATAPVELVRQFNLDQGSGAPVTIWHAVGCAQCRNTGFRGRMAIAEFLEPNAAIERLIFARADQAEIERAAVEAGMVPMFERGIMAALEGETTVEEVVRSIRSGA